MTNRREMLFATAGAVTSFAFTGCGLANPALAQGEQRRREIVVNGRRVRTVDVHAHCHVPEANALMGLKGTVAGARGLAGTYQGDGRTRH
jgi:hypothetical protein